MDFAKTIGVMNITQEQFDIMVEGITSDLIYYLVEKEHQTLVTAIDTVYNSATYKALSNPETGLYYQSSGYVLDYLLKELQYGKL